MTYINAVWNVGWGRLFIRIAKRSVKKCFPFKWKIPTGMSYEQLLWMQETKALKNRSRNYVCLVGLHARYRLKVNLCLIRQTLLLFNLLPDSLILTNNLDKNFHNN